jgi:energy-coupling factor transporter transmembrane protein EcfT
MSNEKSMFETAKSLSRNPLGIIALFIVLVYAVASVVISFAKAEFYQNPFHPAVLFLAIFPLVVLSVFTYLVAQHHRNLYAPQDYKDPSDIHMK